MLNAKIDDTEVKDEKRIMVVAGTKRQINKRKSVVPDRVQEKTPIAKISEQYDAELPRFSGLIIAQYKATFCNQ